MLAANDLTMIETVYKWMYIGVLIFLALLLFGCLIRAVKGPRIADRIVAVNMMGTMVMVMIAVLSLLLREGYLIDICLIYAMVSFLAVIVITKVYMGIYEERLHEEKLHEEQLQEEELQEDRLFAKQFQEGGFHEEKLHEERLQNGELLQEEVYAKQFQEEGIHEEAHAKQLQEKGSHEEKKLRNEEAKGGNL